MSILDRDGAIMVVDDSEDRRKPKPMASFLGGKAGLKDASPKILGHSGARILHT
jgi:hypothetical protein